MKNHLLLFILGIALAGVGGLYLLQSRRAIPPVPPVADAKTDIDQKTNEPLELPKLSTKHLVSPEMIAQAQSATTNAAPAPTISAEATDGTVYSLEDLVKDRPAVLIFIKDKCPCSTAAEPYYRQLHEAYKNSIAFFGVIDGDREIADAWKTKHHTPYPILLDPDLNIIRDFEVPNSAYVALIDPKTRRLIKMWPGYSVDLLNDMSASLAAVGNTPKIHLVLDPDAPVEPYAGCPYPRIND